MSDWIKDRRPTAEDGDRRGCVLCVSLTNHVIMAHWKSVPKGQLWIPTPKPPEKAE